MRDFVGYGEQPPDPQWPNGARLAVNFVLNYEEGGENTPLEGDPASEAFLHEVVGAPPTVGRRNLNTESMFEYGSRAGFWRVHRIFGTYVTDDKIIILAVSVPATLALWLFFRYARLGMAMRAVVSNPDLLR